MLEQLLAWGSSLLLTIGVVWKVVEKYSPKIKKALKITEETLEVLNALIDALEDRKVTKEEIEAILEKVEKLEEALK